MLTLQFAIAPSLLCSRSKPCRKVRVSFGRLLNIVLNEYKKQDRSPRILMVAEKILAAIIAEANAIFLVRDLINKPANDFGPEKLASTVSDLAKEFGG